MAKQVTFGQYWAADSPIHALDPRTKLAGLAVMMAAIFLAGTYPAQAAMAAIVAVLLAVARIPLRVALRAVAPLAFIILFTVVFNLFFVQGGAVYAKAGPFVVSEQGIHQALFLGIRLLLLLVSATLVTLTTTTLDITDAIERFLSPLARFGVPAHEFSMVMGIALRFLPEFVEELRTIRAAQLARGATITSNPFNGGLAGLSSIMVPLFTSAFRRAETLSNGMDARCYHGGEGRTRLAPLSFGMRDAVAVMVLACMAAASIALTLLTR